MGVELSNDELVILTTAISALQKAAEQRKGFIATGAGIKRFTKDQAMVLIKKMILLNPEVCAAYTPEQIEEMALRAAKGAT